MKHIYEYLIGGKKLGTNKKDLAIADLNKGDMLYTYSTFDEMIHGRVCTGVEKLHDGDLKISYKPQINPKAVTNYIRFSMGPVNAKKIMSPINTSPSAWWISTNLPDLKEQFPDANVEIQGV